MSGLCGIGSTLIQTSTTQNGLADQLAVLTVRGVNIMWLTAFGSQLVPACPGRECGNRFNLGDRDV
jgi:hypothetical protein